MHFGNLELEVNGRRSNVILHDNIKLFTKSSIWQHSPETGSSEGRLVLPCLSQSEYYLGSYGKKRQTE